MVQECYLVIWKGSRWWQSESTWFSFLSRRPFYPVLSSFFPLRFYSPSRSVQLVAFPRGGQTPQLLTRLRASSSPLEKHLVPLKAFTMGFDEETFLFNASRLHNTVILRKLHSYTFQECNFRNMEQRKWTWQKSHKNHNNDFFGRFVRDSFCS